MKIERRVFIMEKEKVKKGLLANLVGNKKPKKSSCCCGGYEIEEVPEEETNKDVKETSKNSN
jgi:hypothetical protein